MLVNYDYYIDKYKGQTIEKDTFDNLNIKSQTIIEYIIKKQEGSILELSDAIQDKIINAICSQIEYLSQNGNESALNGNDSNQFTSEKYSSYSYTKSSSQSQTITYINGIPVAPMVYIYLKPTGLLYSGVKYVV